MKKSPFNDSIFKPWKMIIFIKDLSNWHVTQSIKLKWNVIMNVFEGLFNENSHLLSKQKGKFRAESQKSSLGRTFSQHSGLSATKFLG